MNRDERIERVFNTIAGIKNGYGQAAPALRLMAESVVDDLAPLNEADLRRQFANEILAQDDAGRSAEFARGVLFASDIVRRGASADTDPAQEES